MKGKKNEALRSEAQQWAAELESLGHQVVALCEHSPKGLLHWSPPHPGLSSLCALAIQLMQEIEWWVLVQIGERRLTRHLNSQYPYQSTSADLTACCKEWMQEVHALLDPLPDAFLDLYVGSRFGDSTSRKQADVPKVRTCLFRAMERSAVLLGRMEVIHQLVSEDVALPQKINA